MKPEISSGAVLEGKPSLTRVKRLARFMTEAVRMVPKPAETVQAREFAKMDTDDQLVSRGRSFLNALRGNFGDSLQDGLIVRPETDGDHEVLIEAISEDATTYHQTAAEVDIISREGHMTRLVVGATEPTKAARRLRGNVPRQAWVRVLDPLDPTRSYDSLDFSPSEQSGLLQVAERVFSEAEAACDYGACNVYSQV
jgi:hypothetical protein